MDFTTLVTSAAYTIVTPLNLDNNNDIWAFVKPFDHWVWLNLFISVPCFILILGITDYIAKGMGINLGTARLAEYQLANNEKKSFSLSEILPQVLQMTINLQVVQEAWKQISFLG